MCCCNVFFLLPIFKDMILYYQLNGNSPHHKTRLTRIDCGQVNDEESGLWLLIKKNMIKKEQLEIIDNLLQGD